MKHKLLSFLTPFLTIGLSSCISSEVIDMPESPDSSSNEIVLRVSAPDATKTRSNHTGYKLRYVAKIFSSTSANQATGLTFIAKKEIIEGVVKDNEITFSVTPEYNYTILVFADYIPETNTLTDGTYGDYFYDTKGTTEEIKFKGTDQTKSNIDLNFFNNDNLDCFSAARTIYKKAERYDIDDLKLERAVAKIRFVDTSNNDLSNVSTTVSQIAYLQTFQQAADNGVDFKSTKITDIKLTPKSDNADRELFYYYTLAPKSQTSLQDLTFKVTSGDNSKEYKLEAGNVPARKNYITTIKSAFVPSSQGPNQQEGDTGTKEDDGLIHVFVPTPDGDITYEIDKTISNF